MGTFIYPFQPGQAVLYFPPRDMTYARPYAFTRAVVVKVSGETITRTKSGFEHHYVGEHVTIAPLDGGRPRRTLAGHLAHAGFCTPCGHAAHQVGSELRCPLCGGPCEGVPPPDSWVAIHYPGDHTGPARRARRAVLHPGLTKREIGKLVSREDSERTRAFCVALGLDPVTSLWRYDNTVNRQLESAVAADDAEGFAQILAEANARQARFERNIDLLIGLARELRAEDRDPLIVPADLAPLMPSDDRTPDGEDDISRWLRRQMERGERRRAA